MRLRTRLALLLAATAGLSAALASAALIWLQTSELKAKALGGPRLLAESAARMAQESGLTRDPMMLASYAATILATHPEAAEARILLKGRWKPVRLPGRSPAPPGSRRTFRSGPVELSFSEEAIAAEWTGAARRASRIGALAAAAVFVLAAPVCWAAAGLLTRPLARLAQALESLEEGRSPPPLPEGRADELGLVGAKFNRAARRLQGTDGAREKFLRQVAHELRTPMAAIQTAARMAERFGELPEGARRQLQLIQNSAGRLSRLVEQALTGVRLERGRMDLALEATDLSELVRDAALLHDAQAKERGIRMSCEVGEGPLVCRADPERLLQVFDNLISNALKFTPPGGAADPMGKSKGRSPAASGGEVTVYAQRAKSPGRLEAGVLDTGPGIPKEGLPRLFEPHERLGRTDVQGAGLGLSICKAIVEAHGGRISVESAPGRGSRFYFTLPELRPAPAPLGGQP